MISVIIPLYNKEKIIKKTLLSVLSQDYEDFEVIVINDGSTDRSADIVRSFNDSRVRLIEQENGGPSKARNTGVKYANGEWIVFLDADDEFLPNALLYLSSLCVEHSGMDMFCCPYYVQNGSRKILSRKYSEGEVGNAFMWHFYGLFLARTGSSIYKKTIVEVCLFDERIRRFEDLECLFRMYNRAKIYLGSTPVLIQNQEFASASRGRKDIKEDFLGYINFGGKSFWENMCLYQFFLGERLYYPKQSRELYPNLYKRYDLLLLSKILTKLSWLFV